MDLLYDLACHYCQILSKRLSQYLIASDNYDLTSQKHDLVPHNNKIIIVAAVLDYILYLRDVAS